MASIGVTSIEAVEKNGEGLVPRLLYKQQIAPGTGDYITPGSEVEISYKLTVRGQVMLESEERRPYIQQLERILPAGLCIAISKMRRGERALISIDPVLGFGENTIPVGADSKIARNSKLLYEVELISWTEEAQSRLTFQRAKKTYHNISRLEDDLIEAESMMDRGKKLQALKKFRQILLAARSLRINAETTPGEERARQKLLRACTFKAAKCAYETGKYPQAVTLSKEALEMERTDDYEYMYYICGCAYFSLGYIKSALRFVRLAHFADISNETYEKKLHTIEKHEQLLAREVEEDSDKEDFEEYAASALRKVKLKEKNSEFAKVIAKFIQARMTAGDTRIEIGGGFRPEFLDKITADLMLNNRKLRIIRSAEEDGGFTVACY